MSKWNDVIGSVVALLVLPIMLVNIFGGIVSFVWLLFIGQWKDVIKGIVYIFASSFLIGLALMPSLLTMPLAAYAIKKRNRLLFGV